MFASGHFKAEGPFRLEAGICESGCTRDFVSVPQFPKRFGALLSEVPFCPGIQSFFCLMMVDNEYWGGVCGSEDSIELNPTRPFSTSRVVMTMTREFSCHVICQKSLTVASRQPWLAI